MLMMEHIELCESVTLGVVSDMIKARCKKENWVSTYDGSSLTPERVNLYD